VIDVKEIRPTDVWQVKENEQDAVLVRENRSLDDRGGRTPQPASPQPSSRDAR